MFAGIIAALMPSAGKLLLYGGIAVAVIGGVTYWSVHQYNKGWAGALASVARQDAEAVKHVDEARAIIAACRASGGVWRQASGDCQRR